MSKALPADVAAFTRAGVHPDAPGRAQPQTASSDTFRSAAGTSASSSSAAAASSDFSSFVQGSSADLLDGPPPRAQRQQQWADEWPGSAGAGANSAMSALNAHTTRDGQEIAALLAGDDLNDAVDGGWEQELRADHDRAHQLARTRPLPADPLASNPQALGTDLSATQKQNAPGDMSPTSRSLLASLAHLSLAEQTYLRTLLASQDPARMLEDYFARGSYTEDVWDVPPPPEAVREVLDRAKGKEKEVDQDEAGRTRAVRRLEMVLRHLEGATGGVAAGRQEGVGADQRGSSWAREAAGLTGHAQSSRPSAATAQYTSPAVQQATYAPSSLSSSAFVSFAPSSSGGPGPSSAATATTSSTARSTTGPHLDRPSFRASSQHAASESGSDRSDATSSSYEEYAREKEERVRSNEGGRYGPDWTRRPGAAAGE